MKKILVLNGIGILFIVGSILSTIIYRSESKTTNLYAAQPVEKPGSEIKHKCKFVKVENNNPKGYYSTYILIQCEDPKNSNSHHFHWITPDNLTTIKTDHLLIF